MPEEHHLTARNLLEQMNRQFNECNALYHELAVHYGVSDTVFWLPYSLYNSSEPQTQNRLCMEWNLPKQTMNSAVVSVDNRPFHISIHLHKAQYFPYLRTFPLHKSMHLHILS